MDVCHLISFMSRSFVLNVAVHHFERSMINAPGPCVLFATPGMISGGFSLEVFKHWAPSENNLITLPGYILIYSLFLAFHRRHLIRTLVKCRYMSPTSRLSQWNKCISNFSKCSHMYLFLLNLYEFDKLFFPWIKFGINMRLQSLEPGSGCIQVCIWYASWLGSYWATFCERIEDLRCT